MYFEKINDQPDEQIIAGLQVKIKNIVWNSFGDFCYISLKLSSPCKT